jgi:2-polyprenyl-3-methyl-5-hydroxy-6-metoxy-1,4-benzoquinol methylase
LNGRGVCVPQVWAHASSRIGARIVDGVSLDLFASAVPYYARYRSGYPRAELDALAARVGLDGTQRVVDVGCGTGQLAIPLARHASTVLAIDPVADMLVAGRRAARAAGVDNITWLHGDSGSSPSSLSQMHW